MKTEPRDIDREAARLFVPAPGMRVCVEGTWIRVANADYGFDEPGQCATDAHSSFTIDALDTDDPATVGCMLAQMLDKARAAGIRPDFGVSGTGAPGDGCGRLSLWLRMSADTMDANVTPPSAEQENASRVSFGAALVAAMKAIKADPTR